MYAENINNNIYNKQGVKLIQHLLNCLASDIAFSVLGTPFQWRHNEHNGVSTHQPHDCFLNHLSKKTSKLRVTGPCEGSSPVTGEFPAQRAGQ